MKQYIPFRKTSKGESFDVPAEAMFIQQDGKQQALEELVLGYQTLQVTGRELIKYNIAEESVEGRGGTLFRNATLPSRDIKVKYLLQAEDEFKFREQYNTLMKVLSAQKLLFNFNDEREFFFTGTLSNVDEVDGGLLSVISSFTIHCPDPYKYTEPKTVQLTNNQKIDDPQLIYPTIPDKIVLNGVSGHGVIKNTKTGMWIGVSGSGSISLFPNTGGSSVDSNNIDYLSYLEYFTIENGDLITLENAASISIGYRRRLL
ncbi:phage tail family protein [Lactobacillus sp. CC-MHH1034]|uniref:distal tail protein Dit n=1 Tax=Agrilactobacillus fermenti TaxID=2586909 RepID=UPI001E3B17C6|nr:distal tail protein Dit [Agrilactobacillus fermenti]MCD2255780.1 phage tail family protein [Agrilactobacillus fermenti]